jgi:hypothetical protein
VPDPKLPAMDVYLVPEHVYADISADDLASYEGLDGVASGQYSLHRVALRPGLDDGEEPELVRRRQRHRPHRVPRVHERRCDGRRAAVR